MIVGETERVRVAVGSACSEQIRCRLVLTAALAFSKMFPLRRKGLVSASFEEEGHCTGKTYGPLMGRIWDPSPETYNHVHPVVFWLAVNLPEGERVKPPVVTLPCGRNGVDSRLITSGGGTAHTDLKLRRREQSVVNGRKIERAIFGRSWVGLLGNEASVELFWHVYIESPCAYRQGAFQ